MLNLILTCFIDKKYLDTDLLQKKKLNWFKNKSCQDFDLVLKYKSTQFYLY